MKLMRVFSALALALLLSLAAVAQSSKSPDEAKPAQKGPPPKMVIDSLTHDFGEVIGGQPLRHIFKVKNEGKGELVIESVVPG